MSYDKKIITNSYDRPTTRLILEKHGPFFDTLQKYTKHYPKCMEDRESILVQSDKTDWVGWLPLEEIEIEEIHKTPCTSAVLKFLGVKEWGKLQYMEDCTEALESIGWIVEVSKLFHSATVGALRKEIKDRRLYSKADYYMVIVLDHVLLLNNKGDTVCDTAPVERDRRTIYDVYLVIPKSRLEHNSALSYEMSKLE